ncbi:hypothetical protein ABB37_04124 [Leptomonas pyrrhocoris]|uniref:Uncharacterized protein n=1 Tax=Leptomonas pyrrhocoris TaxID=157538 RepID=A0A0M9G456_LEPPY|nr:hypothetical protein ABB37_04124 [Leptomonas pyrrhocoris]KPA81873.1 hypothetical protein ABB37_04124 [Leptomonas pyrrhocoris]|eukprot:XP_015660312.1 hypothetical protein ABB37_04124 [Leptomonas pyrrhocoris]
MEDLRDELDASVLFGSGYICVVGPPSSGKTTLVLNYLVARERYFNSQHRTAVQGSGGPTFCLEYVGARSASNELLRLIMRRLHPDARHRRLSYECTPLEFGASLIQWLDAHGEGSELHLVVDDADLLDYDVAEMNLWLAHCLRSPAAQTRTVLLWMVSELPLRLADCFRFHFVARLEPDSVVQWLLRQYEDERRVCADTEEEEEPAAAAGGAVTTSQTPLITVGSDDVNRVVLEAFTYYATRQPMRSSVVSRDVRLLVQRVYQLLPPLLLESCAAAGPGAAEERKLNARHFAAAWGQHRSEGGGETTAAPAHDPLVPALRRIGYSAVLLAFAAFYGGAVPKRKQHQVFGCLHAEERTAALRETKGQSHKAAVLTASAHVLTVRRLAFLYDSMLRMCTPHIDPLEFTTADVAMQYVQGFVAWGLLTPVVTQRHRSYHCWIPVSTAQQLARELSLSLFDLIPS